MLPPVDFLLVTALQDEFVALLRAFPEAKCQDKGAHDVITYYEAIVQSRRSDGAKYRTILTCLPSMGPVVAAIHITAAVVKWRPNAVLLVGIAAGKKGEVTLGDVVVPQQVADYTLGKVIDSNGQKVRQTRWQVYPVDTGLFDSAKHVRGWHNLIQTARPDNTTAPPNVNFDLVVSGGDVIANDEVVAGLSEDWPKMTAIEMEGGATAAALHVAAGRPRFLMIRGIQDFANRDKNDSWRLYAADAAAAFARELLLHGPSPSLPSDGQQLTSPEGAAPVAAPSSSVSNVPANAPANAPIVASDEQTSHERARARDLRTLTKFWHELPTDEVEHFFDRAEYNIIPWSIAYYYEGIRALAKSPSFYINDPETLGAIKGFVEPFLRSMSFTNFFVPTPGGEQLRFIKRHETTNIDGWTNALGSFEAAIMAAREGYGRLVAIMRREWPEIDLDETSREARRRCLQHEGQLPLDTSLKAPARETSPQQGSSMWLELVNEQAERMLTSARHLVVGWVQGSTQQEITLRLETALQREAAGVLAERGLAHVNGDMCSVIVRLEQ